MSMSPRLRHYLDMAGVQYKLIEHDPTMTTLEAAHKAHIPGEQVAKAVLLEDHRGYLMAIVPASHRLSMDSVRSRCGEALSLSDEPSLARLFDDCEKGAIPAVGEAYGMDVVWDDTLGDCENIYFEAGDHTDLVQISGQDFRRLMGDADHGRFSHHI